MKKPYLIWTVPGVVPSFRDCPSCVGKGAWVKDQRTELWGNVTVLLGHKMLCRHCNGCGALQGRGLTRGKSLPPVAKRRRWWWQAA